MDLKKFSRTLTRVLPCAGLLGVFMIATGCENEPNGLLDPSGVGRLRGEPLIVPIVPNLNIGTDEEMLEFATARDVKAEDLVATASDYTITANDLISISISDLVAPGTVTEKTVRVTQTGKISLQSLPNPIIAEGLTEQQLERAIDDAYRDEQTIKNARTSVAVIEPRGRTFSVLGASGASGLYSIYDKNFRLLDAMVTARGESLPDSGNDTVYIIRRKDAGAAPVAPPANNNAKPGVDPLAPQSNAVIQPRKSQMMLQDGAAAAPEGGRVIVEGKEMVVNQPTPATQPGAVEVQPAAPAPAEFAFNSLAEPSDREIIRVPYDKLKKGELKYNVVIKPGDLIYAPGARTGVYYMGGQVASPGAYSLSGSKITLSQAIVSARGFSETAVPWRTEIIRRLPGDKQVFVMVNLSKIFAGEEPDIYLKPDDRVNVGTTWWAPFLASVRNGFRFTYGFGFLYDKNFNEDDNNN